MARPRCFECGRQLMYVNGKPTFFEYTDPIGAKHKMHKQCAKWGGYDKKNVTAKEVARV